MQICLKCGDCCLETEMLLSNGDIQLIKTQVKPTIKFYENKNGYNYLTNVSGHCIFFDILNKSCTIYKFRPQGCRFYPFILDDEKLVIDKDCRNRENIKLTDEQFLKEIKKFIDLIEKERNERLISKKDCI